MTESATQTASKSTPAASATAARLHSEYNAKWAKELQK